MVRAFVEIFRKCNREVNCNPKLWLNDLKAKCPQISQKKNSKQYFLKNRYIAK